MVCEFQAADLYEALQKTFLNWKLSEIIFTKTQKLYIVIFNDGISTWQFIPRSIQSDLFFTQNIKLEAVIDSYWYYKIQLNYSSWEIRKLKGLLFSIFSYPGFKTLFLNA